MTRIETSRVNEMIGLKIGSVQDAAHKLNMDSELEELESDIAAMEKKLAELKDEVTSLPHKR